MGSDDNIDRRVEEALAKYADAEPRPGLEQRVLEHVRAAGPARRFRFPRWVFAIPALACLLLAFVFWERRTPAPVPIAKAPPVARAQEIVEAPPRAVAPVVSPRRSGRRRGVLPKQPAFPAPAPLTSEERALLAFVKRAPEQAREVFAEATAPIQIEEIKIQPLESDGSL